MLNQSARRPLHAARSRRVAAFLCVAFLAARPALAQAPPSAPPASQELVYGGEAASILGRQVRDLEGQRVGRIVDVLVDDAAQPRAAVIDFGGFMGVGNRRVAVAWRALRFTPAQGEGDTIALDMTADQIKGTPEFRRPVRPTDPPVSMAVPPAARPESDPAAPAPSVTASPTPQ